MKPEQIAFDPGIGFGKTVAHNLSLIKHIGSLRVEGRPLLLGHSRKAFPGKLAGGSTIADRLAPTLAITAIARSLGVNIFRVHDVLENVRALKLAEALLTAP